MTFFRFKRWGEKVKVHHKTYKIYLGFISWDNVWSKYVFNPTSNTMFAVNGMGEICNYINNKLTQKTGVKE